MTEYAKTRTTGVCNGQDALGSANSRLFQGFSNRIHYGDNDADAQDLIQDLAEKILRNDVPATTYQKPLAYFSKIMRNKRRDDLRTGKSRSCAARDNRYVYDY